MKRLAALLLSSWVMFSCSGGGGGSNDDDNNPNPDVTFNISGTVSDDVLSGVTIELSGAQTGATITDENGDFSFSDLDDGNYTITPSRNGFSFSPESMDVSITSDDLSAVDFVATIDESEILT